MSVRIAAHGDPNLRRQIIRACKSRGWTVHPDAFAALEEELFALQEELDITNTYDELSRILDGLRPFLKGIRTITEQVWNDWVESQQVRQTPSRTKKKHAAPLWNDTSKLQVVHAFRTPKLIFQSMRQQFHVLDSASGSLFGTAEDKINMLAQRYALIQQRVLRHKFFRPSQDWYKSTTGQLKITPIESLLGQKPGVESPDAITTDAVLLLGVLLQIEQGSYYLEDTTGQVPVCLQYATLTDASFLTEHSILLVEGQVRDGIVYVNRIGQPLQETREQAVRAIQQQVSHPAFVLPKHSSLDKTPFFIFQDLYMDQPRVLQQLESALAYHERRAVELGDAPVFVFMGNFCSPHAQQAAQPTPAALNQLVKSALEDLLTLISRFSTLATIAQFVIVPGPRDTGNRLLPLPPFGFHQSLANSKVANVHWASNPCRMRFTEKEIVVFRYDLLPLLQQHQIRLPSDSNADTTDDGQALELRAPHCRLLKTVLDQGTLMPLTSVVPVYWNYSQAMALYPLPDCLIIGCSSGGRDAQQHQYDSYHNCRVIQTTSYAQENSAYAIYRPNGVDGEDDENRPNGVDGEDDENDLPTMNDAADTHHVGTDDNDDDNDMIIDDFNVEDEVKDTSSRKESAFFGSGKRAKTDRKFAFSKESSPRCIEEELVQQLEDSAENSAPDSETDDGESNPVRANEEDSES